MDEVAELNAYPHSMLVYFLDKPKNTPDGAGNLLDHALILFAEKIGDSSGVIEEL
jgi:hypothetical protein